MIVRRYFLCFLCIAILFVLGTSPLSALSEPIDVSRECSLRICYADNGSGISDIEVKIYRIADTSADAQMELTEEFDDYPVRINSVTSLSEWKDIATTLCSYISKDGIEPHDTAVTDRSGIAAFEGLETGLYLIYNASAETDNGTFVFDAFMCHLPTVGTDEYVYDAEMNPKGIEFIPSNEELEYKVLKLWRDEGRTDDRPEAVTVDILKDGDIAKTVILNSGNNWSYSWKAVDDGSEWSVVEKDVPDEYYVSCTVRETSFIITNTIRQAPTDSDPTPPVSDAPQTGDTFPLMWCIVVLCMSGMLVLVMGVWSMRGKTNAAKK
ncbi:MAG: Cna B-type domain-containing protein [Ruminococcaceae bacterium]|nr:Cna B-type domain-containing protein [Oscillospiraceae bacterium]